MNPFDLTATELVVWGLVIHVICDWILQTDWMAVNKVRRRQRVSRWYRNVVTEEMIPFDGPWWDRHPAAYVHAGIHGIGLALIFGWAAIPLAISHLIIDTRTMVAWMAKKIKQIAPMQRQLIDDMGEPALLVDIGTLVRVMVDQSWHVFFIALTALAVGTWS